jgi:hypothetical protein
MQAGKQINVQKHEHPINKKSHKLGGIRLGKMDQQEVNFFSLPQQSRQLSQPEKIQWEKNNRRRKKTGESPPCVIYPKGGKGNARSKPENRKEKDKVSQPNLGFGSRLCEGKVLAPLRIRSTLRDPLL